MQHNEDIFKGKIKESKKTLKKSVISSLNNNALN